MADWLRQVDGAIVLIVHVQPGAKRSELAGVYGDALKIRLAAPAIDGRANTALLEWIARRLGVPRSAVELKSGQASRRKLLRVRAAPADAEQRLLGDQAAAGSLRR
jgi:uncharacterized protein (TIGR00251 family)